MKHLMIDLYGVKSNTADLNSVNEYINNIINSLSLKAVMPVYNMPYYYCEFAETGGISSFCLLDNGHITVHTFPFFESCYVDIMFSDFDEKKAEAVFKDIFQPDRYDIWCFDRDLGKCSAGYEPETSFGPHLMLSTTAKTRYTVDEIYDILQALPTKIDMHPISRPTVIKNYIENYSVISGLIIIAESHISFHYDIHSGKVYFDIYSCKFCDPKLLHKVVSKLFGNDCEYQLVSRGEKLVTATKESFTLSDNGWRNNI